MSEDSPFPARPRQMGARNIDSLIELQKRDQTTIPLHRVESEIGDRAYGQHRSNDMTRPRPDFKKQIHRTVDFVP